MLVLRYEPECIQIGQIVFDVQGKRRSNAGQNQTRQRDECLHFKSTNQINEKLCNEKELSIGAEVPRSQIALQK